MTPKPISKRVAVDRLEAVRYLLSEIRSLPLQSAQVFFSDRRNIWAAESCLRRSLEALFDLGRHILAKGYGEGVSEYKEIAVKLGPRAEANSVAFPMKIFFLICYNSLSPCRLKNIKA
ncbi:MAG: hypothetical protein WCB96_12400 [Candidatus Aminicenantales bacterium]